MTSIALLESQAFRVNSDQWPVYLGYKRLDNAQQEIRLLSLLPDKTGIECDVLHVSLQQPPQYFALSYCWGKSGRSPAIRIGPELVEIRETVWEFLLSLKNTVPERPILLWLDVLCINQNVAERSIQIKMMGQIFGFARRVYAWLGQGTAETDTAFDFITNEIAAGGHPRPLRRLANHRFKPEDEAWCDNGWKVIAPIMKRPYWTRLRILQEVILAKDVVYMCGNMIVSFKDVQTILTSLHPPQRVHPDLLGDASTVINSYGVNDWLNRCRAKMRKESRTPIWKLAAFFEGAQCTDSLDRVYGMLAMAETDDIDAVTVDYTMTVMDLYLDIISKVKETPTRSWLEAAHELILPLQLDYDDCADRIRKCDNFRQACMIRYYGTIHASQALPGPIGYHVPPHLDDPRLESNIQNYPFVCEVLIGINGKTLYAPLVSASTEVRPGDICIEAHRSFVIRKSHNTVKVIGVFEGVLSRDLKEGSQFPSRSPMEKYERSIASTHLRDSRYELIESQAGPSPTRGVVMINGLLTQIEVPLDLAWIPQMQMVFNGPAAAALLLFPTMWEDRSYVHEKREDYIS